MIPSTDVIQLTLTLSEDDYRAGCRNVSHRQRQSYSGLRSNGRSNSTYFYTVYCWKLLALCVAVLVQLFVSSIHTVIIKTCCSFLKSNKQAISKFQRLSVKTRCKTKYSCENEFIRMRIKKYISFSCQWPSTQPRIEAKALGNSEMAC